MCVCVQLNHFAVQQKFTQHCKSTILQLKKKKMQQNLYIHIYQALNLESSRRKLMGLSFRFLASVFSKKPQLYYGMTLT